MSVVIEVAGGVVVNVLGADNVVIVDWDALGECMAVVIEVAGGVVVNTLGADNVVIVDWDAIEMGDNAPTLPEGYVYNGDIVEEV